MAYVSDTPSWSAGTACEGIMNPYGSNPVALPCNTIGRYVYVRLQKTQFLELREVEVMVDEKCDTRTPLNTNTEGTCTGAKDGDSCTATCQAGYAKSSGEETAVCRFGEWSAPEPVCVKQCPSVPAPVGTETCTQTVAREQFTKLASGADPNLEPILRFASLDEDTFPLDEYWGVIDGRMVAGAPAVDGSMGKCLLPGQGMVAMLQDPDPSAIDGSVTIKVKLVGEDDAGLVFGAAGPSTYTFVSLGFGTGKHRLVKRIGGVDIELGSSRASVRALDSSIPMDKHELEVRQDGASLLVLLDNVRLFEVEDKAALVGDVGLWTQGRAEFDDLEVRTACLTSGGAAVSGCRDLFYQDTCGFTCRQGFDLVGQEQVSCKADGSLSSAAPDCSIRPPVALDQNRTVVEESDRNTAVGDPLVATLEADEQMEFSITGGDPNGAFKVGLCDGLIRVKDPQLIDYEQVQWYDLEVTIGINGYRANTTIAVRVDIIDRNEAPSMDSQSFNVSENSATGTLVGRALEDLAEDPEDDDLTFSLDFDASNGLLQIDAATGQLSVNHSAPSGATGASHPLDYESLPGDGSYLLIVRMVDVADNQASAFVRVSLLDANDAPQLNRGEAAYASLPQPQIASFDESRADPDALTAGALIELSPGIAASDQDLEGFVSPLTYRLTSKGAQGSAALSGVVTKLATAGGTPSSAPGQTLQGIGGMDLFALNSSTGVVTLTGVPSSDGWSNSGDFQPYLSQDAAPRGLLVRAEYVVEVEVTDGYGATDTQNVRIVVGANSSSIPIVRTLSCDVNNTDADPDLDRISGVDGQDETLGMDESYPYPTRGGAPCIISGTGLGSNMNGLRVWGTRTVGGQEQEVDFTGCVMEEVGQVIHCDSPEGFGEGFVLHVFAQG